MRNTYFDFNNWSRESIEPQEWDLGERPGPYGEVLGEEKRPPLQDPGPAPKSRAGRRERRRKSVDRKSVV